jgi:hypothetical protein
MNPRGYYAHLNTNDMSDEEYFNATTHPHSAVALGHEG